MPYWVDFPLTDMIAVTWLLVCWVGYTLITDHRHWQHRDLARVMHMHRRRWMDRMMERENRMPDVNIIIAHHRSGALFCSTSLLILAGIVAILGNAERLRGALSEFVFATQASQALIELKAVVLLMIFIYGFFKFAWCLRQYNNALVLIGGAPQAKDDDKEGHANYAERAAQVLSRGNGTFNRGMRAYYYGLATLVWFIQPALYIVAIIWVTGVLYRREYRSVTLSALALEADGSMPPPAGDHRN